MNVKLTSAGDSTILHLEGDIDEDIRSVLVGAIAKVTTRKLTIDCTKVYKINSIGVRDWISVMGQYVKKLQVRFVNCPEAFIDMAIMVPAFVRGAQVNSFYAPFNCAGCGREKHLLVEVDEKSVRMPAQSVCELCGGKLSPDEELQGDIEFVRESAAA